MQATFHSYVPIIVVLVYRQGLFSEREAMSFFYYQYPGGGGGGRVCREGSWTQTHFKD